MSRCFPFPPPGYKRNGTSSEALIESIKLQKEREKAKGEGKKAKEEGKKDKGNTKEKRKDRKDKKEKKERKEKEGKATHAREDKVKESKLNHVESYHLEKIRVEPGIGCLQKDNDNEQLERSAITEEHDQPFSSNEPSCLSDSTQSSNKRKRSTSPSGKDSGTIFKIRLPLRKHREHEGSKPENELGSTSGSIRTADSFARETRQQSQSSKNTDSERGKEFKDSAEDSAIVDLNPNLIDSESGRIASVYNSLLQNWAFKPLQCEGLGLEDQDWLFSSERRDERPAQKKVKSVNDALRCSSPTLWPRAQYLAEADIYGLPYAVPF